MDLTPEEIEELNAHGPYNHAVWRGRGVSLSHEESISGRADFLAKVIRDILMKSFSQEEMAQMTIADIGCYDGWVIDQLGDLPFKKFVGIEPRLRNIEKGNRVRAILGIESNAEFRQGSIEAPGSEVFDVVICAGVLHHLESVGEALRSLRAICRGKLILETLCLSEHHLSADLVREIEPKDIVYFGRTPIVGLSGYKLESSYYHGSAVRPSIVTVPTVATVQMFLEYIGFRNVTVVVPPSAYWRPDAVKREAKATVLTAEPGPETKVSSQAAQVREYEEAMLGVVLPAQLVEPLYRHFCEGQSASTNSLGERTVMAYVRGPGWRAPYLLKLIRLRWQDPYVREIIKNLRYAPADKVALEFAKIRFVVGDFAGAIEAATRITRHLNADWRATYRAFLIIARAYRHLGNEKLASRYLDLCRVSNPELPEDLLTEWVLSDRPRNRGHRVP